MATGRGGWTKIGMPSNASGYYEYLQPIALGAQASIDANYLAVHYGVLAIQRRINALGYTPPVPQDGIFGPKTDKGLVWAQKKLGVSADGQFGPKTSQAFFWPVVKVVAGAHAHTVGGICAHESSWDPGAVGFSTPDDHGLVQINAPANPNVTIEQAFSPRFAFAYCRDRIQAAMNTYHDVDIAVCSYASPLWAKQWYETGHSPNDAMTAYAAFVRNWNAPS